MPAKARSSGSTKAGSARAESEAAGARKKAPAARADAEPKTAKAVKAPAGGKKPNALQQPLQPSPELAAVVGDGPMPRGEVVSKVWAYIKQHKLQNPDDGREILADDTLQAVLGKKSVTMFELNKHLARHLK